MFNFIKDVSFLLKKEHELQSCVDVLETIIFNWDVSVNIW